MSQLQIFFAVSITSVLIGVIAFVIGLAIANRQTRRHSNRRETMLNRHRERLEEIRQLRTHFEENRARRDSPKSEESFEEVVARTRREIERNRARNRARSDYDSNTSANMGGYYAGDSSSSSGGSCGGSSGGSDGGGCM